MNDFKLVEKRNHNAVHGIFDSRDRAERHLREVIPGYVARGYFMDKTLTADDFEVIQKLDRRPKKNDRLTDLGDISY